MLNRKLSRGGDHGCMLHRILASLTVAAFAAALPQAASAQAPTPAVAAPAAPAASEPPPPPPITLLPKWMQEKLTTARADPKVMEAYYKQGSKVASFCTNCHGPAGHSALPEVPNLAGQNVIYVLNQLAKLSDGRRKHFFMEGLMRAMNPDEKVAVAVYYTAQEPRVVPATDMAQAAHGKNLYDKMCKKCHGDQGHGTERNARIAGQQPVYLKTNLERYREQSALRGASEKKYKLMKDLKNEDLQALVAYIRSMQ
jgi:cytochrome c553